MVDLCDLCSQPREGNKTAGTFEVCDYCYRWVNESDKAILQSEEDE